MDRSDPFHEEAFVEPPGRQEERLDILDGVFPDSMMVLLGPFFQRARKLPEVFGASRWMEALDDETVDAMCLRYFRQDRFQLVQPRLRRFLTDGPYGPIDKLQPVKDGDADLP